jgi:CBS domain containing-hemolysin-like protein
MNGFYVAGEFAIVAVDRGKVEQLADEGDPRAASALKALQSLSFQLSGAQFGITVSSLMIGFLLEPQVGEPLSRILAGVGLPEGSALGLSLTVVAVVATASQMVLGELMPKNLAIAKPLELTLAIATPFRLANALVKPVIVFLNASANASVRLLGIEPKEELKVLPALDELEIIVRSSMEGGAIEEEEFSLITRSITFGDKTAGDALIPRTSMHAIQKESTLEELQGLAIATGRSRFPVYGENIDDILGVAHVKDLYGIEPEDRAGTPVSALMRPPVVIPSQRHLHSIMAEMLANREQVAIVVDEYGGTEGMLTLEDLLEELVGEIEDEHDPLDSTPALDTSLPPGVTVLSGLLRPEEVEDACGFVMPEGEYGTLGGFLFDLFGRIPKPGDQAASGEWEFKVVGMDGNRIDQVLAVGKPPRGER